MTIEIPPQHWLWKFAGGSESLRTGKLPLQPWNDRGWALATDARTLIIVKGEVPGLEPLPEALRALLSDHLPSQPVSRSLGETTLAALKAWTGKPVWEMPCPACKGTSKASGHVHCSYCEGEGIARPDPSEHAAKLYGVPLDKNRLACALEYLSGDRVSVGLRGLGPTNVECVFLDCLGAWRVVIAPLDPAARLLVTDSFPPAAGCGVLPQQEITA